MGKRNTGNYGRKIDRMRIVGKLPLRPGAVTVLRVEHDDWCDFFKGKPCNCNPNIKPEQAGGGE